ncbi:MAG: hypothetical protein K2Q32_01250 [Alphaproteobacteria bacterium]|nr:hypothetical protein [Alphaproteobacteria bacterium]
MVKVIRRPPGQVNHDPVTGIEMQLLFAANEAAVPADAHKSKRIDFRPEETPGKFPIGEIVKLIENCRYLTSEFKLKPVPGAELRLTKIIEGIIAFQQNPIFSTDKTREFGAFLTIKHALSVKMHACDGLSNKDIEVFCSFVKGNTHPANSRGTGLISKIASEMRDILKNISPEQAVDIKRTLVETALQANELTSSSMRDLETVFQMDLSCFSPEERQRWVNHALEKMKSPFTDRMGAYGINLLEGITRQTSASERTELFWEYVRGEGRFAGAGYRLVTENTMNERGEVVETSAVDRLHAHGHLVYMAGQYFKIKETDLNFLKPDNVVKFDRTATVPKAQPRFITPAND